MTRFLEHFFKITTNSNF